MKKIIRKIFKYLPNKVVNSIYYYTGYKKILNLKKPIYFGEKIQWIKTYGRIEEYYKYVDKYLVREFVKEIIGEEYLIKIYGVYNKVEDIEWDKLPNKFILKNTNGAGNNFICKDVENIQIESLKKELNNWLKMDYYSYSKELQYKKVKSKILCEELIENNEKDLEDYKIFCFKGKAEFIQVDKDRYENHKRDYYDLDWNKLDLRCRRPNMDIQCDKPKNFQKMIEVAEKLAAQFEFVRIDLYNVEGKIYFGEITFTPSNGIEPFLPIEKDLEIASKIELEKYL